MAQTSVRVSLFGLLLLALSAAPAWANPFLITPNNSASQLVANLVAGAPGINVVGGSQSYTGAALASGTFTGGTGIIPFDGGVILTSGLATIAAGPNNSGAATQDNGLPGNAALDALVGGGTQDASVLQFDFIPTNNVISFQYVFGSEEYNFYVGSTFNDVFGFFLNGVNIALIPGTAANVAINSVNCASNPSYYTGNNLESSGFGVGGHPCGNAGLNTQYDGLVGANAAFSLFATGAVNPGVTNHITLAIADRGDGILDSGVFLKAGSFVNTPPPTGNPVPEPASLILLGSGLVGLAARSRKRQ